MILTHSYPSWLIYTLGAMAGSVIAAWLYLLVSKADAPKVSLADHSTDETGTSANERFNPDTQDGLPVR